MNLLENEDLAWERFKKAMTDKDMLVCYDMSLKEFEHSTVHDYSRYVTSLLLRLVILHFSRLIEFFQSHHLCRQCQSSS